MPAADITLQPIITLNLPVFSSLTGYAYENCQTTCIAGTLPN